MVASAVWNKGASFLFLLVGLAAAGGGSRSRVSNRVDCSGGGHLDADFVLGPRRRGDAGSGVAMRIRSFFRSVDLQLPSLHELMQAMVLVLASMGGLSAGEIRGVSPVDVLTAFLRSRRLRRVVLAATPTRLGPLKLLFGDIAAASDYSGEVEVSAMAAADLEFLRGSLGPGCNFHFLRVLSVKEGQLSQLWMYPVISCFP